MDPCSMRVQVRGRIGRSPPAWVETGKSWVITHDFHPDDRKAGFSASVENKGLLKTNPLIIMDFCKRPIISIMLEKLKCERLQRTAISSGFCRVDVLQADQPAAGEMQQPALCEARDTNQGTLAGVIPGGRWESAEPRTRVLCDGSGGIGCWLAGGGNGSSSGVTKLGSGRNFVTIRQIESAGFILFITPPPASCRPIRPAGTIIHQHLEVHSDDGVAWDDVARERKLAGDWTRNRD